MTAGLIQLVATGPENLFLNDNPQVSMFHRVYRRYSNFSIESIVQPVRAQADFGKKLEAKVARAGDLLGRIYLLFRLPRILMTVPNPKITTLARAALGAAYDDSLETDVQLQNRLLLIKNIIKVHSGGNSDNMASVMLKPEFNRTLLTTKEYAMLAIHNAISNSPVIADLKMLPQVINPYNNGETLTQLTPPSLALVSNTYLANAKYYCYSTAMTNPQNISVRALTPSHLIVSASSLIGNAQLLQYIKFTYFDVKTSQIIYYGFDINDWNTLTSLVKSLDIVFNCYDIVETGNLPTPDLVAVENWQTSMSKDAKYLGYSGNVMSLPVVSKNMTKMIISPNDWSIQFNDYLQSAIVGTEYPKEFEFLNEIETKMNRLLVDNAVLLLNCHDKSPQTLQQIFKNMFKRPSQDAKPLDSAMYYQKILDEISDPSFLVASYFAKHITDFAKLVRDKLYTGLIYNLLLATNTFISKTKLHGNMVYVTDATNNFKEIDPNWLTSTDDTNWFLPYFHSNKFVEQFTSVDNYSNMPSFTDIMRYDKYSPFIGKATNDYLKTQDLSVQNLSQYFMLNELSYQNNANLYYVNGIIQVFHESLYQKLSQDNQSNVSDIYSTLKVEITKTLYDAPLTTLLDRIVSKVPKNTQSLVQVFWKSAYLTPKIIIQTYINKFTELGQPIPDLLTSILTTLQKNPNDILTISSQETVNNKSNILTDFVSKPKIQETQIDPFIKILAAASAWNILFDQQITNYSSLYTNGLLNTVNLANVAGATTANVIANAKTADDIKYSELAQQLDTFRKNRQLLNLRNITNMGIESGQSIGTVTTRINNAMNTGTEYQHESTTIIPQFMNYITNNFYTSDEITRLIQNESLIKLGEMCEIDKEDVEFKRQCTVLINDFVDKLTVKINVTNNFVNEISNAVFQNIDILQETPEKLNTKIETLESSIKTVKKEAADPAVNFSPFAWIHRLGHFIIDRIQVDIGGQLFDRQTGEWMNINYEFEKNVGQIRGYYKMIGNVPELTNYTTTAKPEYMLYVPIPFWFCNNSGSYLPLLAMQYQEVIVSFVTRIFEECVYKAAGSMFVEEVPAPNGATMFVPSTPQIGCTIMAEYVYLDQKERDLFCKSRHEFLTEQIQINEPVYIDQFNLPPDVLNLKLYFTNPCKELVWTAQLGSSRTNKTWGVYSYKPTIMGEPPPPLFLVNPTNRALLDFYLVNAGLCSCCAKIPPCPPPNPPPPFPPIYLEEPYQPVEFYGGFSPELDPFEGYKSPLHTSILRFNNVNRYTREFINNETQTVNVPWKSSYFNYVQPWPTHAHTPATGMLNYNFGFFPEELQPSGAANMSKLEEVSFNFTIDQQIRDIITKGQDYLVITIYARCENIMRVMSGLSGLAFAASR